MTASKSIDQLEPKEVFSRFAEICRIPHGSGHEKSLSEHLVAFAKQRNLDVERDHADNVLIRKPASPGCKSNAPVIIQSHMDMVWAKSMDREFDFASQPIEPLADGEWLRANNTTLGADNGIGMAFALALLDGSYAHPPLEALFTTNEETGMDGAIAFDIGQLKGNRLVNLDSEEEGIFYASCCGGITVDLFLHLTDMTPASGDCSFYAVSVKGLKGGHSGAEIHKQRGNAIQLLGRLLDDLTAKFELSIADIHGGVLRNAIPPEAEAILRIQTADAGAIRARIASWQETFTAELRSAADRPVLSMEPVEPRPAVFAPETAKRILFALTLLPHGVEAMDCAIPGQTLVETSSNFALVRREKDGLIFSVSIRSSLASKRDLLVSRLSWLAEAMGAQMAAGSSYPGWAYDPDSRIRKVFLRAFGKVHPDKKPLVKGIHAGLECGVFVRNLEKLGRKLDVVSFGPDILNAHTPEEKVHIASTARTWDVLKTGLRMLCEEESGGENHGGIE